MSRCRYEEVDVRGPLPVPAKLVEQTLCRSIGWTSVSGRHDGAKFIAAVRAGFDPPSQIVFALALIEERVHALRIGVPDVNDCASDRFAVQVADNPMHKEHLTFVGAVIKTDAAFRQWRVRDVERAFDGSRGALFDTGSFVLGVH